MRLPGFFARPLSAREGESLTRSGVPDALRERITKPPAAMMMSDFSLTRKLAGSGIEATRRHLGKYRNLRDIPSFRRHGATKPASPMLRGFGG